MLRVKQGGIKYHFFEFLVWLDQANTLTSMPIVLIQTIQFSISIQFSSNWPIYRTVSSATTPGQILPGSDGNTAFAKAPTFVELHHQIILCYIQGTHWWSFTPQQGSSQRILLPNKRILNEILPWESCNDWFIYISKNCSVRSNHLSWDMNHDKRIQSKIQSEMPRKNLSLVVFIQVSGSSIMTLVLNV